MPHSIYPPFQMEHSKILTARSKTNVVLNNPVFLVAYKIPYQHNASFGSKSIKYHTNTTLALDQAFPNREPSLKIKSWKIRSKWMHNYIYLSMALLTADQNRSSNGVVSSHDLSKSVIVGLLWGSARGVFTIPYFTPILHFTPISPVCAWVLEHVYICVCEYVPVCVCAFVIVRAGVCMVRRL